MQDLYTPIDFSELRIFNVPVTIGTEKYILNEATGEVYAKYRNASVKSARLSDKGKVVGIGDVADADYVLLAACMERVTDSGNVAMTIAEVKAWPSRVSIKLIDRIKAISGIDDEEDTVESLEEQIKDLQEKLAEMRQGKAKNEPSSLTDGSE